MKTFIKISISAFALIISTSLQAQKAWTLEECINQAISSNIQIQQQSLQTQSAKADVLQSKLQAAPSINGSASNNWQTGFNINPKTNLPEENLAFRTNSFGASANMPLFNGFQTVNNMRLKESDYKASQFDLENTKNTISLNVANAYLSALQQAEILAASTSQADATRKILERQQKLYDLGGLNRSKLLQLKAQLSNEEYAIINNQANLNQAYLNLWQLINVDPSDKNTIEKPNQIALDVKDEVKTVDAIYNEFEKRSPDVVAAQHRLRSADLQHYVALGGRSVRLSVTGSASSFYTTLGVTNQYGPTIIPSSLIGYYLDGTGTKKDVYSIEHPSVGILKSEETPFSEQFKKNFGTSLGLTLSVPIFNGWSVNTNIQKANIQQMNAKLNEKQVKLNVYKNVNQSYLNFKNAIKRYEASQETMDANKEAYEISEKQFELGALNISDYISSKNSFNKSQNDYLQAKYEVVFRRKVLDFYEGKPLK
ncbi:MAG: TolC family protein [Bacteroidetes bacterium]|nr:TolC family protein [Bacteroidota bacterium]